MPKAESETELNSMETTSGKTIHRTKLTGDFTVLPNALLRNTSLSFKARGILAMMLSNVDGWETHTGWIEKQGTEGREAVRSGMQELEAAGYCRYDSVRGPDGIIESNQWTWYDVPISIGHRTNRTHWQNSKNFAHVSPSPCDGNPSHGQPSDGKPCDGKPSDGLPSHGNPSTKKEQREENQHKKNEQKKNQEAEPALALPEDPAFPKAMILATFNLACPSLPKASGLSGARLGAMKARWHQLKGELASWEEVCKKVEASDFLTGRAPRKGQHANWKCNLDWVLNPHNFDKIREGLYDNQKPNPNNANPSQQSWF